MADSTDKRRVPSRSKSNTTKQLENQIKLLEKQLTRAREDVEEARAANSRDLERLEAALETARTTLAEQEELLAQLTANPIPHGTALEVFEKEGKLNVLADGKVFEVELPGKKKVKPGNIVKLTSQTLQVIDVSPASKLGSVSLVDTVNEKEKKAEVDFEGHKRVVIFDPETVGELRRNDQVLLDATGNVIIENRGQDENHFVVEDTSITWQDVGGLELAKEELIEAIEVPYRYPELYEHYNTRPVKGILLYGPPGNGKTLLGKAAATSMALTHKDVKSQSGFIYVKGPEILSKFVGIAEQTVRLLFDRARRHEEEHGFPCVVFIDEADAILPKRGSGKSSDVEKTIVPQFLSEMDGMQDSGSLVILATNRADTLDPAVLREGRVDRKIKIGNPNKRAAVEIFKVHLKPVPHRGISFEELATAAADMVYSEESSLFKLHLKSGDTRTYGLEQLASGAMLAGLVDRAVKSALQRDRAAGGKPTGVMLDDMHNAVNALLAENRQLDHKEGIDQFANAFRKDVQRIERVA